MSESILKAELRELVNSIRLHRAMRDRAAAGGRAYHMYFDTASVIDMLLGWNSIRGFGRFHMSAYERPCQLVYALAYKNWLGSIQLLPPHIEELTDKLLSPRGLFRERPMEDHNILEFEFLAARNLKATQLKMDQRDASLQRNLVSTLVDESKELFKYVYLKADQGFWKSRYQHLRNHNILRLEVGDDYRFDQISKSALYKSLLEHLNRNERRGDKQANNYIDAIALCLLDEKLREFEEGRSDRLPLFFTDQKPLLDTVLHCSARRDARGRRPFTYTDGKDAFLIVRDAEFFLIDGVYTALVQNQFGNLLEKFVRALDSAGHDPEADSLSRGESGTMHQSATENILLEFFHRWWDKGGFEEFKGALDASVGQSGELLRESVDQYIEEERQRLRKEFMHRNYRIDLIKKSWERLKKLGQGSKSGLNALPPPADAFKELEPRFCFTEAICAEVQQTAQQLYASLGSDDGAADLQRCFNMVVEDLLDGLELMESPDGNCAFLDHLARGLGVLWLFHEYELIGYVCDLVRRQYEFITTNDDKYPNSTTALLHAAALLRGRANDGMALQIITCVEQKFAKKSHQVRTGLSHLYYLLAKNAKYSFDCPEWAQIVGTRVQQPDTGRDYIGKANEHCLEAIGMLNTKMGAEPHSAKMPAWRRFYHYGLNNRIFFNTITMPARDFLEQLQDSRELADAADNQDDLWQEGYYDDTLARFHFRRALLAQNDAQFRHHLEEARRFNGKSLEHTNGAKEFYHSLKTDLMDAESMGFLKIHDQLIQPERTPAEI